eukprot:4118964-Amphidinium_carterae.1
MALNVSPRCEQIGAERRTNEENMQKLERDNRDDHSTKGVELENLAYQSCMVHHSTMHECYLTDMISACVCLEVLAGAVHSRSWILVTPLLSQHLLKRQ